MSFGGRRGHDDCAMASFVLIPGAGADPRVYDATIEELRGLGHAALAPELPLGDPHARPSDHADAVARAVPEDREIVVVAKSLGAFTGPLVAERTPVAMLILIAPMIPRPGETAGAWWENTRHAEAIAPLLERHGPTRDWGPDAIDEVFLHDVDPEVAAANERFSGTPGEGMFTEPWPLQAWPDVPVRVLIPREDRLFPLDFQRRVTRERLGLEIDEMAGGHLPMLSRPAQLSERLVELARRA
jgi:pimeloyl-ACP methyl ester carboxylesterase